MKTDKTLYYKVTTQDNLSCICEVKAARVQYKVGRWVSPNIKGSKLMVFSGELLASEWAKKDQIVHPCHIKNPSTAAYDEFIHRDYQTMRLLRKFWSMFNRDIRWNHSADAIYLPFGTVLCDEVKLLK